MSGGATGISAHLARCLVPFAPRLVFLGGPLSIQASIPKSRTPNLRLPRRSLSTQGIGDRSDPGGFTLLRIEATYHTCDVTDPEAVRAVMGKVAAVMARSTGLFTAPESSGTAP